MKHAYCRVTPRNPCPICGHNSYCTVRADGSQAKCMRVPSKESITQSDGTVANFHPLTGEARERSAGLASAKTPSRLKVADVRAILKDCKAALGVNGRVERLHRFATSLGLSVASLKAYGIGYYKGAWSFPMYDADLKPIGVRLRDEKGRKSCVPGSANGLFVPVNFDPQPLAGLSADARDISPLLLLFPEGPTSSAAAFDLGHRAVGRPNNNGGGQLIHDMLMRHVKQDVVVVADRDGPKWRPDGKGFETPFWPGWEGALSVVERLVGTCDALRVIQTPKGVKDLRDWVKLDMAEGGMLDSIVKQERSIVTRGWLREKHAEVERYRAKMRRACK